MCTEDTMWALWVLSLALVSADVGYPTDDVPEGMVHDFEDIFANETIINAADPAKYEDCDDLIKRGAYTQPGSYRVYLNTTDPMHVFCNFDNGDGRVVIMQQKYGRQTFALPYQRYLYGFGSAASGDVWMGLIRMKQLTDAGYNVLTVTMQNCNYVTKVIRYNYFALGPYSSRYRLSIGAYVTPHVLPDDFSYNNGMPFHTIDQPDLHNCAAHMRGGWWYNYCTLTLPTGHYYSGCHYDPPGHYYDGIFYSVYRNYFNYSLPYFKMELSRN